MVLYHGANSGLEDRIRTGGLGPRLGVPYCLGVGLTEDRDAAVDFASYLTYAAGARELNEELERMGPVGSIRRRREIASAELARIRREVSGLLLTVEWPEGATRRPSSIHPRWITGYEHVPYAAGARSRVEQRGTFTDPRKTRYSESDWDMEPLR